MAVPIDEGLNELCMDLGPGYTGITRAGLHKALSSNGNPSL
jgi:DNA-binding phage protein